MAKKEFRIKDKQGNLVDYGIPSSRVMLGGNKDLDEVLDEMQEEIDDADGEAVKKVTFNGGTPVTPDIQGNVSINQEKSDWTESNINSPKFIEHKPDVVEDIFYEEQTRTFKKTRNGTVSEIMTLPEGSSGYEPPEGGIPKEDLHPSVQTSLGLADTALQAADKAQLQATINAVQTALNNLMNGQSVTDAIDTFNEVVDFLNGIDTDDPKLANQLLALNNSITALQTALAGKISGIKTSDNTPLTPDSNGIVTLPPAGSTISPATAAPSMDGNTALVGSSAKYAREDHVHPHDTSKANATDVYTKAQTYSKGEVDDAIDDKLTDVTVAAVSGDVSFFVRDNALCISTESFVTVTSAPTITKAINSDGTATITITHSNNSAIIEYSLDGGTTWQTYSTALTINTAGTHTIKARAQVSGSPMSDIVTDTVTLVSSAMPTLSISKTSSDVTITASGNGTVVMTVDGTAQTSPYTVNRGSDSQTLAVVVTNKEANKLIATLMQSVVVPKVTVVTQKIITFCNRVISAEDSSNNLIGHLIHYEPQGGWTSSHVTAMSASPVTDTDLLAAYEATQEVYDEHALLLGQEPELDFLGYKGTKASPTYLYSVNENCDADSLSSVSINSDGLIVASQTQRANIKWTKYSGIYSTRFAPDITYSGDSRTVNRDFEILYMASANGLLDCDGTTTNPVYWNCLFGGFQNSNGYWGSIGNQDSVLQVTKDQTSALGKYDSTGMTSVKIDRSSSPMVVTINGETATTSTASSLTVGSRNNTAHAYMQMKANSPLLVLAY